MDHLGRRAFRNGGVLEQPLPRLDLKGMDPGRLERREDHRLPRRVDAGRGHPLVGFAPGDDAPDRIQGDDAGLGILDQVKQEGSRKGEAVHAGLGDVLPGLGPRVRVDPADREVVGHDELLLEEPGEADLGQELGPPDFPAVLVLDRLDDRRGGPGEVQEHQVRDGRGRRAHRAQGHRAFREVLVADDERLLGIVGGRQLRQHGAAR